MILIFIVALFLSNLTPAESFTRIIGGTNTNIKAHPHQVSLKNKNGSHICGASIIGPNWVVTAAHCVDPAPNAHRIGLNGGVLNSNEVNYTVAGVFVHPNYNKPNFGGAYPNDIALIKTSSAMDFSVHGHSAISLAAEGSNFEGSTCTISGWGNTATGGSISMPSTLQHTTGKIDGVTCAATWGSNYNSAVHICIDNKSSGACNGDSGGPMVCHGDLAGVTSWGASGCNTAYPSVYTKVSSFRSWVLDTMAAN